jgi:hypothetical protein
VAAYQATVGAESATSITVTPHYTTCSAGGINATVHLNGCHFLFKGLTQLNTTESTATADVVCPPGQSITITVGPGICTVHIPAQQNLKGVTFTNMAPLPPETPKPWVTAHVKIENQITYTETRDSFLCPFNTHTLTHNGDFTTDVKLKGFNDLGNQVTGAGTPTPGVTHYLHNTELGLHVKTP